MYQKMVTKFNSISFTLIASLCALVPLVFLSANAGGASMVKGFILFIGVFLAASFWLVGQFIDGSLKIPRSSALLALGAWTVLSLISALTSANVSVSLWGRGFVFDSFATTLVLSLFVFLIATFAREQRRLVKLFLVTFSGAAFAVFLQIILYVSQRVSFVSKYLAHVANQGTLVGSWVDFAYFVTFVFILALLIYEVLIPRGFFKLFSLLTMIVSLIALVFLNFTTAWIISIAAALVVFVYKSSVERSLKNRAPNLNPSPESEAEKNRFPLMSLISLLLGLFFFLSSNSIGVGISRFAGISFNDIRPSFSTTTAVMRSTLYRDPLFGIGAGRYGDAWNLYHPAAINTTIFWNSPFEAGYNLIQSIATTTGILPALAFLIALILSVVHGFKLFNASYSDRFTRFIAVTSLIMTLALAILSLFASPGIVLIVFGFIYIGLLFGVSSLIGKTTVRSVEYLKDPRLSFFAILLLVVASMSAFSAVYFTGNKFASIVLYNRAISASNVDSAERNLNRAINLSNSDIYWRARTVLYVNQFKALAETENPDKTKLQNLFTQAEQSAQAALSIDRENATNWLTLSQVYQLVADSSSAEILANASQASLEAQKRSPKNPFLVLNNASILVMKKDTANALAELDRALVLKPNYLDAYIFKGQIEQSQGDSQALKNEILKYISTSPYDEQGYISLGNLYVTQKDYPSALDALSRARQLNPDNANTYLLYISTLEISGNKTKAVEELKLFKKQFPAVQGIDEQIERIQNGI